MLDAASSLLQRQQAHEPPPAFFIQHRDQAINRAMLFGRDPARVPTTGGTTTFVFRTLLSRFHLVPGRWLQNEHPEPSGWG
jgi:hypothetical protein